MKKVMFISSAGGHLSELMQLKPLFKSYDYCLVTEKTDTTLNLKKEYNKVFYVMHSSRKPLLKFMFKFFINFIKSTYIYINIRPDVIVTTGANSVVPMCYIGKLFGCKIVYIESFARVKSLSLSGKLIRKKADLFLVQHEEMLSIYPEGIYEGSIF